MQAERGMPKRYRLNRPDLARAIGEELRPLCENAEYVQRLVSHPWLVEQVNATAIVNNSIIRSKWYYSLRLQKLKP